MTGQQWSSLGWPSGGWLKASVNGKEVLSLPQADPYTEIYTVQDKWYRLINPEWVNPAKLTTSKIGIVFNKILDAQTFHQNIGATYHSATYLSYAPAATQTAPLMATQTAPPGRGELTH